MTVDRGKGERIVVRNAIYHGGMCPRCEGMGSISDIDLTQLYDDTKSLAEGAITIPGYKVDSWWTVGHLHRVGLLDPNKPIRDYTKKELDDFLYKEPTKVKVNGVNLTYEGLVPKIQKSMLSKDPDTLQPHIRAFVDRAVDLHPLPRLRRHPAQRAGPLVEDRRDQHRRRLRDADRRSRRRGCAAWTSRRSRRCSPASSTRSTRSWRSGSAISRSTGRRARCRAASPSARG